MKILAVLILIFSYAVSYPLQSVYAQEASSEEDVDEELEVEDKVSSKKDTQKKGDDEVLTPEQAKAMIDSWSTSKDAVGGTVNTRAARQEIYDFYSRQIAFREKSKKFTESLLARQKSFAEPRTKIINQYKENLDKIYKAESKVYQEEVSKQKGKKTKRKVSAVDQELLDRLRNKNIREKSPAKEKSGDVEAVAKTAAPKMPGDDVTATGEADAAKEDMSSSSEDASESQAPALAEKEIPSEDDSVKKKVVMPDDAPDFDPSKL